MGTKRTIAVVVIIVAVCVIALSATVIYNEKSNNRNNDANVTPDVVFTNQEVIVFSDDSFVSEVRDILKDSTSKVNGYVSDVPSPDTIVVIDEAWLKNAGSESPSADQIKEMIESGIPLIFVKGDSYLYKDSGIALKMTTDVEGSSAYGICYYGPDGTPCTYSYTDHTGNESSLDYALPKAYAWAYIAITGDPTSLEENLQSTPD